MRRSCCPQAHHISSSGQTDLCCNASPRLNLAEHKPQCCSISWQSWITFCLISSRGTSLSQPRHLAVMPCIILAANKFLQKLYSWLPAHMAITCPIFHHSFGAVTTNRMTTRVTYFSIDHWTSTAT